MSHLLDTRVMGRDMPAAPRERVRRKRFNWCCRFRFLTSRGDVVEVDVWVATHRTFERWAADHPGEAACYGVSKGGPFVIAVKHVS